MWTGAFAYSRGVCVLLTNISPVTPYKPTPIVGVSHTRLPEGVPRQRHFRDDGLTLRFSPQVVGVSWFPNPFVPSDTHGAPTASAQRLSDLISRTTMAATDK